MLLFQKLPSAGSFIKKTDHERELRMHIIRFRPANLILSRYRAIYIFRLPLFPLIFVTTIGSYKELSYITE